MPHYTTTKKNIKKVTRISHPYEVHLCDDVTYGANTEEDALLYVIIEFFGMMVQLVETYHYLSYVVYENA